jgi:hypothetical protein
VSRAVTQRISNCDPDERLSVLRCAARALGSRAAEDRVSVHNLQATLLHLLGIDHERFTYRFQGRRYRLTDVFGEVVPGMLA